LKDREFDLSPIVPKKRITTLKRREQMALGHLVQVDTIALHLFGLKRYIITAIDIFGKIA